MLRLPRLGCSMIGWNEPAAPPAGAELDAALRVAGDGVLDLDHVGTPVGQHRTGRGREGELRHLEDAHAFHRSIAHRMLVSLGDTGQAGAENAVYSIISSKPSGPH